MSAPTWLLRALAAAGVPPVPAGATSSGTICIMENSDVPPVSPRSSLNDDYDSESYEERAAIMEFEAGLARPEAERLARAMVGTGTRKRVH